MYFKACRIVYELLGEKVQHNINMVLNKLLLLLTAMVVFLMKTG